MSGLAKRCNCPFDTPTDRDKIKQEGDRDVTYCGECRGFVSSVPVVRTPVRSSITSF